MAETTEFVQGDYTFYIRPMDPFKALPLLGDLQKLVFPVVGSALGNVNAKDLEKLKGKTATIADLLAMDIDLKGAFMQASSSMNGVLLTNLMQTILNTEYISFEINGAARKLDKATLQGIYNGNLSGMFALAWKVLQVNYADFFTMLPTQSGLVNEEENQ